MEQKIIELLNSPRFRPMKTKEMAERLDIPPEYRKQFTGELLRLQKQGKIVQLPGGRWEEPQRAGMLAGRLSWNARGFGFVIPSTPGHDSDVYISPNDSGGAMDGDTVLVSLSRKKKKGKERGPSGRVVRVLHRAHGKLVGSFHRTKGGPATVFPDDPSLNVPVKITRGGESGAKNGEKTLVEITGYPDPSRGKNLPEGRVVETLGKENTPEIDELAVIHQFGLPEEFPPDVEEESKKIPFQAAGEDLKGREDFSDMLTLAVDPEDARDCDDALSMFFDKKTGEKVVLVHIADVSSRVKPGSRLDEEAEERGLSVYLLKTFIPMLPVEMTQKKLSFREGEKKAAKTAELRFDRAGKLLSSKILRSIVKLDRQFSYGEVKEILESGKSGTGEAEKLLKSLDKLACRLRARRQKAGSIDLDVPEYEVKTGEDGKVSAVSLIERDRSHGLVEEFMLAANVAVAGFLREKNLPAIYRVHEKPEEEDLEAFADFVETVLGRRINPSDRKEIQKLLAEVRDTNFSEAVNMELLMCMKRARYTTECSPHFALHFPAYCHFTSPIRRYPDLIVHRLIDEYLSGRLKKGKAGKLREIQLEPVARHCSEAEDRADRAEREIIKIKLMRFLEERGVKEHEVFEGVVTGVKEYGFFAQLKDFSVEGLAKTSAMQDDFYEYFPEKRALEGRKTGRVFRLGQTVKLTIEHIDMKNRRMDFRPAE